MIVEIENEHSGLPNQSMRPAIQNTGPEEFFEREDESGCDSAQARAGTGIPDYTVSELTALVTGVIFPTILLLVGAFACSERITMLILKHPIESIIEIALCLLVPLANYKVLVAVTQKDLRNPIRNGLMIGLATGTALFSAVVCCVANALVYPIADRAGQSFSLLVTAIAIVSLLTCVTSMYLGLRLRGLREFSSTRLRTGIYCLGGILMSLFLVAGSEAKSVGIRVAEYMATSENKDERQKALDFLRSLKPELELRMECSDERAGGLPGMFIHLDPIAQRQVYFAVAGRPFRDSKASNYASMPDDYLNRHVVGAAIPGLSLLRSAIRGTVSSESLASTLNWTYVLKNRTYYDQEARAQFSLPPGAVISGVTLWVNGEPRKAQTVPNVAIDMAASSHDEQANRGVTLGHDVNTLVSDLGHDRYLVHCFPVPAQGELKISMTIVSPVQPTSLTSASVTLPRLIDTNFSLSGEHDLRLRSDEKMTVHLKEAKSETLPGGQNLLTCNLKEEDLTGAGITICLNDMGKHENVAAFDPISRSFVIEKMNQVVSSIPKNLYVVIDGSESMRAKLKEIKNGLRKLTKSINTSVLLANEDNDLDPQPLASALDKLTDVDFIGGQNNLSAVVKAAQLAGESAGGAVLWIHSGQPSLNQELYISSPYTVTPAFYELPVDNGITDANEFFKNHKEIGPFKVIGRSGTINEDLSRFLSRWQPGGSEFVITFNKSKVKPDVKIVDGDLADEIISTFYDQECQKLLARGQVIVAGRLGSLHNLVTPASTALIRLVNGTSERENAGAQLSSNPNSERSIMGSGTLERTPEQDANSASTMASSGSTSADAFSSQTSLLPQLQGTTNGAIGPQGADATYVTGVNTAGTVRVNNLANLEAMFNIFTNVTELAGLILGSCLIGCTFLQHFWLFRNGFGRKTAIIYGVILILGGLAFPGIVNWFVASARDANLFS